MEDGNSNGDRWTCEACGCITNSSQENPTSCSVCGSARQVPDLLRRGEEPLSSQLLRRSFFVRRGGAGFDFQRSFSNARHMENIENDMLDHDEEDDHAVAALALEVAGVADAARIPGARSRREQLLRSAAEHNMPFGLDAITTSSSPPLASDNLLEIATENATIYDPKWEAPEHLGMRRKSNTLIVGDDEYANIATLPIGATEGKSIRTIEPIPRLIERPNGKPIRRETFGFRVTFKRPFRDSGKSLGGGYLVGLTTSSFSSFDERNSLQQSTLFWGIDDNGHKYEGGPRSGSMRGSRRTHHGVEMSPRRVTRNADNVLYGCLETITVVVDMENRAMTFWRDDNILGSLVRSIPRAGALYPVAVPFNSGALVSITGLNGSPVACLQRYEAFLTEKNIAKAKARRRELCIQRAVLVQEGKPTALLEDSLRQLFALYSNNCENSSVVQLDVISASRLWYRSGLKLKNLGDIIEKTSSAESCLLANVKIAFEDFYTPLCTVLAEDEIFFNTHLESTGDGEMDLSGREQFEVGNIVELVEGYEKYGDAARGPMVPGDRGQVVEVQQGANGERYSIRVLYNGRRWWYQPQTLLAEKSGLVATPAVWFVQRILRSHGFDHISLLPKWGQPVTNTSWLVGDVVTPASLLGKEPANEAAMQDLLSLVKNPIVGRIVPPSSHSGSQDAGCDRESSVVCVEFVDASFGIHVDVSDGDGDERSSSRVHRVKVSYLRHAGISQIFADTVDYMDAEEPSENGPSTSLPKDISLISKLDVRAIESVSKECEKNPAALARVFASGLPSAVFQAVEFGRHQTKSEDDSNLLPAISALGNLLVITARHLFEPEKGKPSASDEDNESIAVESPEYNVPGADLPDDSIPDQPAPPRQGDSFGLFRGTNEGEMYPLGLRNQTTRSALSRRLRERAGVPPFGRAAQPRTSVNDTWGRRFAAHHEEANNTNSNGPSILLDQPRSSQILKLHSPALHLLRRGGFEALLPGEDARRGSPVLNAATKSAISNGILANNHDWFSKVVEIAKRRKGASSTSSLVNARDEDSMPLLVLAISLGCSASIVSYLLENGSVVDDDVIRKAAYLGQKDVLAQLLAEHVYVEGILDRRACSQEIQDTIDLATTRQREQEEALYREGKEFISAITTALIRFAIECRCRLAPRAHIYRSITHVLVGRVLLRAMHLNRLKVMPSAKSNIGPSKPKGATDSESGRVNIFRSSDFGPDNKESTPSAIASSEGLLFVFPPEILAGFILRKDQDPEKCPLTDYLRLLEGLLWTKEVEDIALGLSLTSILLRAAPFESYDISLRSLGIVDLVALHRRESDKQLEAFDQGISMSISDSRRFSTHHVAARPEEVTRLVSAGVVLCPKCHPAELHLTRHSSFRCDLCGKGVASNFPMLGCITCDWDACEECINKNEGGVVKWKHIRSLANECSALLSQTQPVASSAELSAKDWSMQMLSARIKAHDVDALQELSVQLKNSGAVTMFEFVTYFLPVLHESLYGDSPKTLPSTTDPPKKKHRPQFRSSATNIVDHQEFLDKAATVLVLEEVLKSLDSEESDHQLEQEEEKKKVPPMEIDNASGDETAEATKASEESPKTLTRHTPELLRRLQEVLSFCEDFPSSKNVLVWLKEATNDLQSITKPWAIEVIQSGEKPFTIHAEPLMQLSDLTTHLLRSSTCSDEAYVSYCQSLAEDKAIIVERPGRTTLMSSKGDTQGYTLAQVISFESDTGAHTIKYASKVTKDIPLGERYILDPDSMSLVESVSFDGEEKCVILGCRQYSVLQRFKNAKRDEYKSIVQNVLKSQVLLDTSDRTFPPEAISRGTRVERSALPDGRSKPYTIIGCSKFHSEVSLSRGGFLYDLVSDDGEVIRNISHQEIKDGLDQDGVGARARMLRERMGTNARDPTSRMIALRGLAVGDDEVDQSQVKKAGVLKRTWSALSPLVDLAPLDLNASQKNGSEKHGRAKYMGVINSVEVDAFVATRAEKPPELYVKFSLDSKQPSVVLSPDSLTLACALRRLSEKNMKLDGAVPPNKTQLYFSVHSNCNTNVWDGVDKLDSGFPTGRGFQSFVDGTKAPSQVTNDSFMAVGNSALTLPAIGETMKHTRLSKAWTKESQNLTLQCMQLIDCIGRYVHECGMAVETSEHGETVSPTVYEIIDASLESRSLTKKLTEQLDQTLAVVSGALPTWCIEVPSLAPRLFGYNSRRQLLERSAFGVSRATMRLQEAKVNVGPLRQRMAALRGRAVELVGEAFSGGAEDPTALQLQADELYGMEEALGARVNAAFRAQRWHERSLQCAKAAIRRDRLLQDAAAMMERYTSDKMARQRRLEVRFEGESGFDAASGDEAGVTRGFYADVAESLISCQHVTSTACSIVCPPQDPPTASAGLESERVAGSFATIDEKLPLWIPDLDASRTVIIPTPRASTRSTPGVYPRPLSLDDPRMAAVKARFRFMGRMFAGAMRDGFMFPLPLSCSFLSLVQNCPTTATYSPALSAQSRAGIAHTPEKIPDRPASPSLDRGASDEYSCEENTPTTGAKPFTGTHGSAGTSKVRNCAQSLGSLDLPRPGFLGGEVFAVENYVCKELDRIDGMHLREDEAEKRYIQVAANRSFAREALAKSYDCSFEEYFEDRTFVDPFDPTQGPQATALCSDGHRKEVTIFNVREWVELAKQFILRDGVIEQAKAFRLGVNDFFPLEYLRLFSASELQRDVCGGSDKVEEWTEDEIRKLFKLDGAKGATEALVAVAAIGGEGGATLSRRFGASSPTIGYLIKTLLNSTTTQRRQFLNFVTSVPIVTPGKIEVSPIVSPSGDFMPVRDNCLPRGNTCSRRLYLPKFDSYEKFSSVLWSVIREESRFKGFYEWRGS